MKTWMRCVFGVAALVGVAVVASPAEAVAPPTTQVELRGKLRAQLPTDIYRPWLRDLGVPCPGANALWLLTDGDGKSTQLYLGSADLQQEARRLSGLRVVVHGRWQVRGSVLVVTSLGSDGIGAGPLGKGSVRQVIGMDVAEAQKRLQEMGYPRARIASMDGMHFPLTMDYRFDRANLHICNGKVVGVSIG